MGRRRELKDMGKELRKAVLVLEEAKSIAHPNHHTINLYICEALRNVERQSRPVKKRRQP